MKACTTFARSPRRLRVIHVFGILHRDLKPANVMLREDNSPVLIDFGLARRALEDRPTGAGQVLGSPYYISPEQAQGQPVDARTDLYSLGVIFYEMLTGQRPYCGAQRRRDHGATHEFADSYPASRRRPAAAAARSAHGQGTHARYVSAEELLADLGPLTAVA